MKVEKYKSDFYNQVNEIYIKSFPPEEQYISLEEMLTKQNAELYCLVDNEKVLGMIYLIYYNDMIFILYLAVNTENRSKGYGSLLLKWCLENYGDKKIYLNIEEVKENVKDYEIRKKRLDFYLKNGFFLTNYMSMEEDENFNILSNNMEMDLEQYKILDKVVADLLNEPISNIVKI